MGIVEYRSCSSSHTRVPYCPLKSQIRISSKRKTMKNCCRFWALLWFLFATIQKGQSEIKCELKSGVNSALNKVGSAALRGIYYHGNRNSQNMHLMDCYCIDEDVRFNDDYVDELNEQFKENWYEAEIFRIHSC